MATAPARDALDDARGSEAIKPGRVATAAMMGTAIEWYDFFVYGTSAVLVLGPLFFPTADPLTGSLLAFSSFGIGFLIRPLGAVVLAHFGDRFGRKPALVFSMLLMGGATLAVGLLPTYDRIGMWAPLFLVLLRCAQGFAVGGEWGGAVLLAVEHAPPQRRAWYGSFPQYGTPLGLAGSSLAILLAHKVSGDAFLIWGWRLPFLFSGVLIVVGLWIRFRITEAEEFLQVRRTGATLRYPVAELARSHRRELVVGVAVTLVCHAGYIVITFLPAYAAMTLGVSSSWSLVGLVVASGVSMVVLAVVGRRADRVDRRRYAAAGALLAGVWAFPAFAISAAFGGPGVMVAMTVTLAVLAAPFAVVPSLLADQFPVQLRYTGVSASFQLSAVLGGALVPIAASWLVGLTGSQYWPAAAMVVAAGVVTTVGAARCRGVPGALRGAASASRVPFASR
jgi:MFS transporter, MHS family, shikimate and dehydroshikimate transport protein